MSYQIKATPFFQRILSTSKKSGELQKLKEEYERIKDFNEKAIETKMRQVRLKRLFEEIEEIKVADLKKRRLTSKEIAANKIKNFSTEQRLHNLTKAKEMGQHFSRRNAVKGVADSSNDLQFYRSNAYLISKRKLHEIQLEEAQKIKERMNRRTSYGNDISNWNVHKLLMGKLHREVTKGIKDTANIKSVKKPRSSKNKGATCLSETSLDGKEKLKYRISYGNTISDLNMLLMPKRKARSNLSQGYMELSKKLESEGNNTVVTALSDHTIRPETNDNDHNCIRLQDYFTQPLYACDPQALEKRQKAQKRWHKLLMLLRFLFGSQILKLYSKSLDTSEEDLRYQLRSISNDTNLLQSDVIPEYCEQLQLSENEDEYLKNEILLKAECFSEATPHTATKVTGPTTKAPLPLIVQQQLKLKPIPRDRAVFKAKEEEVEHLLKLCEPLSMQVVKKESSGTRIQKMRQIFEHNNVA